MFFKVYIPCELDHSYMATANWRMFVCLRQGGDVRDTFTQEINEASMRQQPESGILNEPSPDEAMESVEFTSDRLIVTRAFFTVAFFDHIRVH